MKLTFLYSQTILVTGIAIAVAGWSNSALPIQPPQAENFKTFTDWCLNQKKLTTDAKHTVKVLLEEAKTQNCQQANQKLTSDFNLILADNQIRDIRPLQSLSQLVQLALGYDISDIKPLQSLSKLVELHLDNNKISDIKPLQSLSKLVFLYLGNNKISDIKPLQSLSRLEYLALDNNKISDIKPLQSLSKLKELNLENNKISDIKSLKSLSKLKELYLYGNPIPNKTCPLPKSVCHWEKRKTPLP
jgi:internalin A